MKTASTVFPQLGTHPISQLYADLFACDRVVAHHAAFDINVLKGQNPFLDIPVSKVSCTMARAQCLSLPGGLDELCSTLNFPGKDPRGRKLVLRTCKPFDGKFHENINEYRELIIYNVQDVHCLMNVHSLLPELNAEERIIFERSWRKNDIGLPIDLELATAIALRRETIENECAAQLREVTGNVVTKITQRARILTWANEFPRSANIPGTKKHEVAEALESEELHPDVRAVLEVIQENGGSAPMKAQALLDRNVKGFYKDATRYHGARSGRGTSEGANLFNIARPSGKHDIVALISGLKAGFSNYDNTALTDALRGCIVAPRGYAIIDNDLSNAELRLALWQCDDRDRLNILKTGGDLYMHNAITMWGLSNKATKETHPKERYNGKTITLGANYQLGWKTYKAHMRRISASISDIKAQSDIADYRKSNPKLVQLWNRLKDAFYNCYYDPPGRVYYAGKIALMKDGTTIWMTLPSGRSIPHYSVFVGPDGNMGFFRAKFGAMLPQKVFGGSLLEISCQSMTRDIITACESDIERELPDITLLLDVYDSVIAIAPVEIAKQREEQMRAIMRRPRSWTEELPLDAEGYSAERMRK
jgi:DNA polymerase